MATVHELTEQGYKPYEAEGITVFWKPDVCQHSGNCVRGDSEVFSIQRRPWINPAGNSPEAIAAVIDTCPSGALRYVVDGGGANS